MEISDKQTAPRSAGQLDIGVWSLALPLPLGFGLDNFRRFRESKLPKVQVAKLQWQMKNQKTIFKNPTPN
jgi:hypothetical protein